MPTARKLERPIPLVCMICSQVIGADEGCSWRERSPAEAAALLGLDDLPAFIVPGAVAVHDKCGMLADADDSPVLAYDPTTNVSRTVQR